MRFDLFQRTRSAILAVRGRARVFRAIAASVLARCRSRAARFLRRGTGSPVAAEAPATDVPATEDAGIARVVGPDDRTRAPVSLIEGAGQGQGSPSPDSAGSNPLSVPSEEPHSTRARRPRSRRRGRRAPLPETPAVTFVRVGPGRYVRAEEPAPAAVARPEATEETAQPADCDPPSDDFKPPGSSTSRLDLRSRLSDSTT